MIGLDKDRGGGMRYGWSRTMLWFAREGKWCNTERQQGCCPSSRRNGCRGAISDLAGARRRLTVQPHSLGEVVAICGAGAVIGCNCNRSHHIPSCSNLGSEILCV